MYTITRYISNEICQNSILSPFHSTRVRTQDVHSKTCISTTKLDHFMTAVGRWRFTVHGGRVRTHDGHSKRCITTTMQDHFLKPKEDLLVHSQGSNPCLMSYSNILTAKLSLHGGSGEVGMSFVHRFQLKYTSA